MPTMRYQAEEIVAKLRQADVLTAQGTAVAEAVRRIGVTGDAKGLTSQSLPGPGGRCARSRAASSARHSVTALGRIGDLADGPRRATDDQGQARDTSAPELIPDCVEILLAARLESQSPTDPAGHNPQTRRRSPSPP